MKIDKVINLCKAIMHVHKYKDALLAISHCGDRAAWNQIKDDDWNEYKKARDEICQYPKTEKLLKKLGII